MNNTNAAMDRDIANNLLKVGDTVACDAVGKQSLAVGKIVRFNKKMVTIEADHGRIYNKYPKQISLVERGSNEVLLTRGEVTILINDKVKSCIEVAKPAISDHNVIDAMMSMLIPIDL